MKEQSEAEKWFILLVCSSSCEDNKKKDSVESSKGTAKGKGGKVEKSLVGSGGPMRQQLYRFFLAFPARPLRRQATRMVTFL